MGTQSDDDRNVEDMLAEIRKKHSVWDYEGKVILFGVIFFVVLWAVGEYFGAWEDHKRSLGLTPVIEKAE